MTFNEKTYADDVLLDITGKFSISGWESVRITRSIERCPNDFTLEMTEAFPGAPNNVVVLPGDSCQIYLGKTLVLTGYVDTVQSQVDSGEHRFTVTGRGKCQDLVDGSAIWKGNQITNGTIQTVAAKLAAPYDISVSVAAGQDVGDPIPLFNFGIGETAFSIIETMCRFRAFLAYEMPDGSLRLERASSARAASALHEGVNVESASSMKSMAQRYSVYESYLVDFDAFIDAGDSGNYVGKIFDPDVPRFRHRYVHVEAPPKSGIDVQLSRARWECNRRIGRGFQTHIITDTWRDSAGNLYEPNTLIEVLMPSLKIEQQDLLIAEVTYSKDQQGTHCELFLMPSSAFEVQPSHYRDAWMDTKPVDAN